MNITAQFARTDKPIMFPFNKVDVKIKSKVKKKNIIIQILTDYL